MIEYIIGRNSASLRADRFLLKATTAPSSLIYKAFRKKDVKINGKWIKEDYLLCEGDVLRIYIKEDFQKEKEVTPCKLTAPIIYEDEHIIIFNKPAALPCQPDANHPGGTLSDMLKSYLAEKGEYNPKPVEEAPAVEEPAPKPDDIALLEEIRDILAKEKANV